MSRRTYLAFRLALLVVQVVAFVLVFALVWSTLAGEHLRLATASACTGLAAGIMIGIWSGR